MADKSPRNNKALKSGKSIKEKRADKKAKAGNQNAIEIVPAGKKR